MEAATAGRVERTGHLPWQHILGALGIGPVWKACRKQCFSIGMQWLCAEVITCGALDYSPKIHDTDLVTHVSHRCQIMANEEKTQRQFSLKVPQKIQELSANRDVLGRYRFQPLREVEAGDGGTL